MDDLERVELSAMRSAFAAPPADVAHAIGLAVLDLGEGAAFSIGARPKGLLFNRVLGLEDDARLAEIAEWYGSRGCTFVVSLVPGSRLEPALEAHGFRREQALMKFRRGVEDPPERETSLRVERIDEARAADYGSAVAAVFGVPVLGRWFEALPIATGWCCFGAFDGDRLVGTAALHVAGTVGWLGAAGTLPEARGRGAQTALLSARIRAAAACGVQTLATETSDREHGEAGPSFRNVVRAGFDEAYRQQWWRRG